MSQVTLTTAIGIETEAVVDAAQLLAHARANLYAKGPTIARMGLASRLDAMARASWTPGFKTIEGGVLVMTPPASWTALLVEARRLGVL